MSNHRIIYCRADNSIAVGVPNQQILDLMTGGGGLASNIEQSIAHFLIPTTKGGPRLPKFTDASVRPFINGISTGGLSESEALAAIALKDCPGDCVVDHYELADNPNLAELFKKKLFFESWECSGGTVHCNMDKARGIHLTEIRRVRNGELVKEDIMFMRAVEAGDTDAQATIKTKKQILRDIPQTFDLTTENDTPDELKQKWPEGLPNI